MGDPRFNSMHLDLPRREDFRRARDVLLQARGMETICAERGRGDESSRTLINNESASAARPACWLLDGAYTYPIKVGVNTLGRSAENDFVVEELFISRRHCAILMHRDCSCVLQDMSSKNGTYLNGARVQGPTRLRPGDEIRICNRQFVFQAGDRAAASRTPPSHTLHD